MGSRSMGNRCCWRRSKWRQRGSRWFIAKSQQIINAASLIVFAVSCFQSFPTSTPGGAAPEDTKEAACAQAFSACMCPDWSHHASINGLTGICVSPPCPNLHIYTYTHMHVVPFLLRTRDTPPPPFCFALVACALRFAPPPIRALTVLKGPSGPIGLLRACASPPPYPYF